MKTEDFKRSVKFQEGIMHLISPDGNEAVCPFRSPTLIPIGTGIDGRQKLELIHSACNSQCPLFDVLFVWKSSQNNPTEPDKQIGIIHLRCQRNYSVVANFDPKIIEKML